MCEREMCATADKTWIFHKSVMNTRTKQQRVSIQNSIDTLCSYIQQMNILSLIMYSFAINNKTVSQSKNFNWLLVLNPLKKDRIQNMIK